MKTASTLLFIIIAAAYIGPSLDDHSAESASAAAAIAEQKEAFRMAKAATEICGENASWTLTDKPGEILCVTKHGRKTALKGTP